MGEAGINFQAGTYIVYKKISGKKMSHKIAQIICIAAVLLLTAGCGEKADKTKKLRDLEFDVMSSEQIPEELQEIIEEKKEESFKLTFSDENTQYICVGYGQQPTGGYSISVTELYETENAVYVHTNLLGPSTEELKKESPSYPHIVIRLEKQEKTVVFE